ncbi:bifunctional DNA primase/polymerase [Actinosynnema mirum]|uniref:Bifunctional DNA primase/polymerase n=1 Tax=Actinosynnema mirum (strain ATCC 29888 / DSM 43827 / JCM 3225 / NBRC 14064 / NCIMB 13271 / NRRL B-12336 / IMRU 3971 / 101) TaxID=446462 RepID=C6WCZ7_ACTMD|nr:bifunctional DNA primase/polymerase [Actinosynnema mirum]ACU37616.1 Bifunctional DNA primase/polymerase [Actinosynnema mirum DSM 43827]AXX31048.1 hypothetical protein APASM_3683 [Actinosynnema pretiosum subsp. pretiosum]
MSGVRVALAAVERGWPVIPLRPGGKAPVLRDWDRRATADPDRVRAWWARAPFNVGIACRGAGLLVVDLDVPGGREVFEGLGSSPVTYRVGTPSGGEHRYFRAPPVRLGNSAGRLGPRVDTRGVGGYVVAAGSAVRGVRYRVLCDEPVAPAPEWLVAALAPAPRSPVAPAVNPSSRRVRAYRDAVVAGEVERVRGALPGTRAHVVFTAACRLGELVGAGWLGERQAEELLLDAASTHVGVDGWTEREAARHVRNGVVAGSRRPRVIPEQRRG